MKNVLLPQIFYYRKPRLIARQQLVNFQFPIRKLDRYFFRPPHLKRPKIKQFIRRKERRRKARRKRLLNLVPYEIARVSFDTHKIVSYRIFTLSASFFLKRENLFKRNVFFVILYILKKHDEKINFLYLS